MRLRSFILVAAVSTVSSQAQSQQSQGTTVLDEITVTAARAERSISDIPQSVQIIGQQEIEDQLNQSASPSAALAKLLPGFSVANQTISGASESYRGRDLLVLIDGVPLSTPLRDVARILAMIDLNSVERIEMVAGASSLYGAGATGGTVNFITKKAQAGPPRVTINTALRAFTANPGKSLAPEASVSLSGRNPDGFDYVFVGTGRGAQRTYDGAGRELSSDAMLGQGGGDRFISGNFFGKVGKDFEDGRRLEFSAIAIYLNQRPQYLTDYSGDFARPDFTQPYSGKSVLEDTKSFSLRYNDANFALGNLNVVGFYNDVKKRFNYSVFSFPFNNPVYYSGNPLSPTSPFNQTTLFSDRGGVNLSVDTPLDAVWNGAKLTWGSDVIYEKTTQQLTNGQDVFTPLSQTTSAGFALLQVPLGDRLTVRGGVRYEHFDLTVDDFVRPAAFAAISPVAAFALPPLNVIGGRYEYASPTYNAGATFKLGARSELFGGFSQGFALPDVGAYTRRAGLGPAYACPLANPSCTPVGGRNISYTAIAPEAQIVNSYELGIRGGDDRFKGSLSGFVSTSEAGVTFDPLTNRISQQEELIYGVEFIGEIAVTSQLSLGTILGYREGRYDSDKNGTLESWLPNNRIATPFRGTIFADYRFENGIALRVEGEGFAGRAKPINTAGTIHPIDGGMTMNVAVSGPWQGGQVYASINNLLDAELVNPTATSVRNLTVYSWGRTATVGYRRTF